MLENVGKEWKINVKKKLKRSYNNLQKITKKDQGEV
jgi:hypothetical protein